MEQILKIGVITSTHGLGGEVKVYPLTDDPSRYDRLREVLLKHGRTEKILTVERVRYFKQFVIVKFKDLDSIEDVEGLRQAGLYVRRKDAVPLAENEYFVADLIGMTVMEEDGHLLGRISDVLMTGANDVYEVTREDGSSLLIPAISDCIRGVDVEASRMVVHLLPGL